MDITAERLKAYPELARALLIQNIGILQRLPAPFASFLLREAINYDWRFPLERREISSNFTFLASLPSADFDLLMQPFRTITLPAELSKGDWLTDPIRYSEKLSAHLWATGQIDGFRSAAVVYVDKRTAALPPEPRSSPRVAFVMIGEGAKEPDRAVFQKLRSHGTHFTKLQTQNALPLLLRAVSQRAASLPAAFAHWYIDGGQAANAESGVTTLSYGGLVQARALLQAELKTSYERRVGSEVMRSQLAQKKPQDLGLRAKGDGAVLDHFAMSILTEGSGTQIYSTTFVQWAAREALRRAQPLTLLVRFRPRQQERPMQELLLEAQRTPVLDPEGSVVDAEMGAYYTWLNAQRLPGAEQSLFLAVFEAGKQAIAIGPKIRKGAVHEASATLEDLLNTTLSL